jgi:hypothetical protein
LGDHTWTRIQNDLEIRWASLLPLLLGALLIGVLSVAVDSQNRGVHVVDGRLGQVSYVYYVVEAGPRVMILHDAAELTRRHGELQASRRVHWFSGRGSTEGRPLFDWELEMADGQDARFRIDGSPYHLADGAVFLVRSTNGTTTVRQLQHDLSTVSPDAQNVARFADARPALSDFTRGIAYREARH